MRKSAVGDEAGLEGFVDEVSGFGFGWPKKDVMEPFDFGFFASSEAKSTAFRLRDMIAKFAL